MRKVHSLSIKRTSWYKKVLHTDPSLLELKVSSLFLLIILQSTQTLQLFIINLKEKLLQQILNMPSSETWVWEKFDSYN